MGLGEIKATSGAPTRQAAYNAELHTQAPENKPCFVPDLFGSRPVCCSPRHSSAFRRRHPPRRRCRNALNKPPRLPHRRMTTAFCSAGQPSCAPRIAGSWTPPWKQKPGLPKQRCGPARWQLWAGSGTDASGIALPPRRRIRTRRCAPRPLSRSACWRIGVALGCCARWPATPRRPCVATRSSLSVFSVPMRRGPRCCPCSKTATRAWPGPPPSR